MKRTVLFLMVVCIFIGVGFAADVVLDDTLTDSTGIVSDTNFAQGLFAKKIGVPYTPGVTLLRPMDCCSFQAVVSSETTPAVMFTDGKRGFGNIVVSSASHRVYGSTISINGTNLVEGIDWSLALNYSSTTATNISLAIQASAELSAIILSTAPTAGSVVGSTAIYAGANYTITSSTGDIAVSGFDNSIASDMSAVLDRISKSNSFVTGLPVILTSTAGTVATGLAANTTYYAIPTSTYFGLASTKANAIAGTAIDISSLTYATAGTFTLTPIPIQDNSPFSFKWQASNDDEHWFDFTADSITVLGSSAPSNHMWDFTFMTWKYIRVKLIAGDFGSISLKLQGYGKKTAP